MDLPDDFVIEHDGQLFRPVGTVPHVTHDGRSIVLIQWETNCPRCDAPFSIATTTRWMVPRRFCDACKRRGRTVKAMRKALRRDVREAIRAGQPLGHRHRP